MDTTTTGLVDFLVAHIGEYINVFAQRMVLPPLILKNAVLSPSSRIRHTSVDYGKPYFTTPHVVRLEYRLYSTKYPAVHEAH
jgi:hypothetical protein